MFRKKRRVQRGEGEIRVGGKGKGFEDLAKRMVQDHREKNERKGGTTKNESREKSVGILPRSRIEDGFAALGPCYSVQYGAHVRGLPCTGEEGIKKETETEWEGGS